MKRIIAFFCLLVVLTGCKNSKKNISIFIYDQNDTFITTLENEIQNGLAGNNISVDYANKSQMTQNEQIDAKMHSDILLINMVDRLASGAIIDKANRSNIPIIFFNREPIKDDMMKAKKAFYIGSNSIECGILQADLAASILGDISTSPFDKNKDGIIQTIIIKGELGHQDTENRTKNCLDRLAELDYKIKVLATTSANWSRLEAYEKFDSIYKTYGDSIELILSNNDDMALGIIDYCQKNKILSRTKKPFVLLGVDGTDVGVEAVRNGYMDGTILNDAKQQARAILNLIDYITNKKDLASFSRDFQIFDNHYIYISGKIISNKLNN